MADDDFFERIDELIAEVGTGQLSGQVVFDQSYARYQHEDLTLRHPRGGMGKFLSLALSGRHRTVMNGWANNVLHGSLPDATINGTEQVAKLASALAPIEFGDLRESDQVEIRDHGEVIYKRLPIVPRLPDDVLEAKMKARHLWGGKE